MMITVTPAVGPIEAQRLGEFLKKYEIRTANLAVWQCIEGEGCSKDSALTKTVSQFATAAVSSAPMSMAGAAIAGPITLFFGAWLIPMLLALLAGEAVLIHETNRRTPGGETMFSKHPDYSEIRFDLTNVSAERLAWTEYLIYIWCANNGAKLHGAQHTDREAAASRAIAKHGHGYYPKPWSEQPKDYTRKGNRSRTARKASRTKRSIMREIKSLW